MKLRDYIHPDWFVPIDWWRARRRPIDLDVPALRDGKLVDLRALQLGPRRWKSPRVVPVKADPIPTITELRRSIHSSPPPKLNHTQIVRANAPIVMGSDRLKAIQEMEQKMRKEMTEGEERDARAAERRRRRAYDDQGMV